ncbi:MAG: hypothetical protein QOK37_2716 [Thermoanaerobaculia bacterium]|jgi:hypothetical protein|nr:hypothetical protein [Thermoanaerobaculia bacterium]
MSEEGVTPVEKPFELFELVTAVLLGLAAIGAALAGLQSGQWGGRQMEAFAQANSITTHASKSYSEAVSDMNSDYAVIGQAKRLILEGIDATNETDKRRSFKLASYYLTQQLDETAYDALKLPKEKERAQAAHTAGTPATTPAAATPPATATTTTAATETATEEKQAEPAAAETAAPATSEVDTEEEVEAEMAAPLEEKALIKVLGSELHDDDSYETAMFAEGNKLFADADKKFEEGRKANNNGDEFELAGLYYTIALFFAGLGLVFKTKMRWGFAGAGIIVLLISTGYLITRTWAS